MGVLDALLNLIIHVRLNISDQALIMSLKALSWAARNDSIVCHYILSYDKALDELLDFLRYPHKGIKI